MRSSAAVLTLVVLAVTPGCNRTPEASPEQAPVAPPTSTPTATPTSPLTPTPSSTATATATATARRVALEDGTFSSSPTSNAPRGPDPTYRLPAGSRIVAIGDLHGDLQALRATLRLAGAIDSEDTWIGEDLTVVQTGDQVDRGDQDREVLDVIEKLEPEAAAAGGALHVLNGNHEFMNASFDFRYVTPRSFATFNEFAREAMGAAAQIAEEQRGRAVAFAPGGPYAQKLAKHLTVAQVGDTLFAHAGVLPASVDYGLARINREASDFLAGKRSMSSGLSAGDSPIWTRFYGGEATAETCSVLARVLEQTGTKRLVVGHTVQGEGINGACDDRLFRIDVGLSAYYGGTVPQVLEITAEGARILRATPENAAGAAKKSQRGNSRLDSHP